MLRLRFLSIAILIAQVSRSANLLALDFTEIDSKNRESVVFIKSIKERKDGTVKPSVSSGTGFLVDKAGYVLTNNHVVPRPDNDHTIQVVGAERSRNNFPYPLTVVARDEELDLALLQFPDVGKTWQPVGIRSTRARQAEQYCFGPRFSSGSRLIVCSWNCE
jgi:S1-C subfamily serine protease